MDDLRDGTGGVPCDVALARGFFYPLAVVERKRQRGVSCLPLHKGAKKVAKNQRARLINEPGTFSSLSFIQDCGR